MEKHLPNLGTQLVFVGGPPRSGTTLLQRILGRHPSIYAGPEFDFVPNIIRLRGTMAARVRSGRIADYLTEDALDAHFAKFLGGLLDAKRQAEGKAILSEKTPANAEVMPEILRLFAQARGVVLLRDPRDVMASLVEVGERFAAAGSAVPTICTDVPSAIDRYMAALAPIATTLKQFPDRARLIYYEDLVTQPAETADRIFSFLGLPAGENALAVEQGALQEQRDPTGLWHTQEQLLRPISAARIGAGRQSLSADALAQIKAAFAGIKLTRRYF